MSFRAKVLLVVLLSALPPALLLGWMSWSASRSELEAEARRRQTEAAHQLADGAADLVFESIQSLKLAATYLPLTQLSTAELSSAIAIPFRQLPQLEVLLATSADGSVLGAPMRAPSVRDEWAKALPQRAPLQLARETGAAVGVPYHRDGTPAVAIAVRPDPDHLLIAELSLAPLAQRAESSAAAGAWARLTDAEGHAVIEVGETVSAALAGDSDAVGLRTDGRGDVHLVARATAAELGWSAAVGRRASQAFSAAERVRRYTLFWGSVALIAAVGLGLLLAREVTRPVASLAGSVRAVTEGQYEVQTGISGSDELGRLGQAFDRMAQEIRHRDEEIRRQNTELEHRVAQKTKELKEAQEQIDHSRRMAALGSFSAGLAHELNNPLTGIIGMGSLLQRELGGEKSAEKVAVVLREARRMAKIVAELKQSTDAAAETGARFPLQGPLQAALASVREELERSKVKLVKDLSPRPLEVEGNPEQIQAAIEHLLRNALTAMRVKGGTLTVSMTSIEGNAVRLQVQDTGKGISAAIRERIFDPFFTTKDDPRNVGLGLTVVHRTVEQHHGRVRVESEEGKGATFTMTLPAARAAAHLA
jgi:signal transduction histidine kinase